MNGTVQKQCSEKTLKGLRNMRLKKAIREIFRANIPKTIWFNFKMLPLKQAIKFPVFVYGKSSFRKISGRFVIDAKVSPAMIKIGKKDKYVLTDTPLSVWTIEGTITFHSDFRFYGGSYVFCAKNAKLSFMGGGFCGSNVKIICFDSITLHDTRVTWDCQIMDSSFHYLENLDKPNDFKPLTDPVVLGDHVWICNNTTISKGTVVPSENIIASHSLVNKDFSDIGPYNLLAGVPAKVKASNVRRIYDSVKEAELDNIYNYCRTHL